MTVKIRDENGNDLDTRYPQGTKVLTVGTPGSDTNVPSEQAVREAIDAIPASAPIVTTVGTPGSDTNVPSEQAVREAIDASTSGTVEDFGCYFIDKQTDTPKTAWSSVRAGTGINVSETSNFTNSSFNLNFVGAILYPTNPQRSLYISGTIKKKAGSDPVVFMIGRFLGVDGASDPETEAVAATMSTSGSLATLSFDSANIATGFGDGFELERVDSSNELCFRINMNYYIDVTDMEFFLEMSGPLSFAGTPINTGNQGTKF